MGSKRFERDETHLQLTACRVATAAATAVACWGMFVHVCAVG
jgi:hypothetical protein